MKSQKGEGRLKGVLHAGRGWAADSWVTSAVAFRSGVLKGRCLGEVLPGRHCRAPLADAACGSVRGHLQLTQHLQ